MVVDFPHLLQPKNVTRFDIEFIDFFGSNHSHLKTRLATEFVLVAAKQTKRSFQLSERKTLDIQDTPDKLIMKLIDISSTDSFAGSRGK